MKTARWMRGAFCLLMSLLCSACANLAGPEYSRPQTPAKGEWSDSAQQTVSGKSVIQPDWWRNFNDPYLDQLIDKAIAGSLDIRILAARIDVARAGIDQAKAGAMPTLTASQGVDHFSHTSAPGSTRYSLAGEASWELDIWGKIRKGVEAQQAEYKATEADWRAGYLTLVSDVSSLYFNIRRLDEQRQRQATALSRNREILQIYQAMHGEGLIPETQVMQQQAEINRLETEQLELARQRKVDENGLATLLGMPANTLKVPQAPLRERVSIPEVPAGLPSQLLARRPDILAAEYRVLQAHNLSGQARLAKLPSIGLTGRAGTAGFSIGDLFKAATFGLASAISFPIFDPNISARVKVADAQTKVTEEEYRRTVISAFEDVENALTNLSSRKQQQVELQAREEKLKVVSDQMKAQLHEGIASQLQVFEVERSLLDAEQQLLSNQWQILSDTVALYKSLGGGWPSEVIGRSDNDKQ
ncbi:MAG: efflux transporter outer membrane subunit [Candidatus Thiodiazotropha sp.]